MTSHNEEISNVIDNVLAFKKFLDTVVDDINSGEYNIAIIKKISENAEEFFSNMEEKPKFVPKTFEMNDDSDDEEGPGNKSLRPNFFTLETSDDESDAPSNDPMDFIEEKKPQKKEDKILQSFLNNDLCTDNYHYLKNINLDINTYCKSCYIY
jgi:hypothetical protein